MIKNILLTFVIEPKRQVLTLLLVILSQVVFAQKKISKQELTEDFVQLKGQLEKLHLGLYYYETKEDFEKRYAETIDNFPDSLTITEAYLALNSFVGGLQDLHTSVLFPKNYFPKDKNKALPMVIRKKGDKFYIHLNGSTDSTILRGEEIISVDKIPVKETFEKSKGLFGTDKANQNSKNFYAERYFARNTNILYGIKDSMLLELKNTKKDSIYFRKISTELTKNSNKILAKRYKNINRKNLNFKIVDSLNHVAVMDVVSFSEKGNKLDFHQLRFNKLVKKNFKAIEENNIKHLIVDFRFNGGGLLTNTKRITKYVATNPFVATDSVRISKSGFNKLFPPYLLPNYIIGRMIFKKQVDGSFLRTPNRSNKPSKKHHYDGNLYVLMDGGSYSATTLTIGLWKDMNRATFVGNTVGGANWGSFAGQWKDLKLNNSKFKVHIPLMKLVHGHPNKTNKTFFVEPDYYVDQSFEDFIRRKDSPMDFVLDLIKNK
ncbi:S41 family peptidase [Lacihabitans soyangensis]|uniref:Tail specific protease domain-containing protein n=1 Tax=Lacihabitans soyangensis TaxID=869394 RepID=A0AAE3H632_9BACT|nr:S41 family peptidase [Lacihabitans soyangensis]MCP9764744.1 hypothetical protein [Lacihabitans soyangensis]